jgi:hypothetical protein
VALNIHQTTQPPLTRADMAGRPIRRRHLVLAMAAGLFAIVVGVWRLVPDNDTPSPSRGPAVSIVSSRGTP